MTDFDDDISLLPEYPGSFSSFDEKLMFLKATIERAITLEVSQTRTAIELRNIGVKFSNNLFSSLFQVIRDKRTNFSIVPSLSIDQIPDADDIPTVDYKIYAKYGYIGEGDFIDRDGTLKRRGFRVDTDDLLSRRDVLLLMQEYQASIGDDDTDKVFGNIKYIGVVKQ